MILDHIAITVADIKASVSWYKHHLNAEVAYVDDTWAMLKLGNTKLALTIASQHPPHLAFAVDSVEKIPSPDGTHRDGSVYQYIKDLDGNTIEYVYYPQS